MPSQLFYEHKSIDAGDIHVTAYFSATYHLSQDSDYRYIVYETWLRYPEHLEEHFECVKRNIFATYDGAYKNTSEQIRDAIQQADNFFALIQQRVYGVSELLENAKPAPIMENEAELPF